MSKKILIFGKKSKIAEELTKKLKKIKIQSFSRQDFDMRNLNFNKKIVNEIKSANYILLLHCLISPNPFLSRTVKDLNDQVTVNLLSIIKICEIALKHNREVKIIILGSESGFKGSYDIIYALTKNALHKYVEERKIKFPQQQLLCLAPSTIIDSRLTLRRSDKKNVKKSISLNPKKRGIKSFEISKLIYSLFFEQTNYISNTVIKVDGGKFARM